MPVRVLLYGLLDYQIFCLPNKIYLFLAVNKALTNGRVLKPNELKSVWRDMVLVQYKGSTYAITRKSLCKQPTLGSSADVAFIKVQTLHLYLYEKCFTVAINSGA